MVTVHYDPRSDMLYFQRVKKDKYVTFMVYEYGELMTNKEDLLKFLKDHNAWCDTKKENMCDAALKLFTTVKQNDGPT